MAALAGGGGADEAARLQAVLKDPMFADIDRAALETADVVTNFPGITEALLRLYTDLSGGAAGARRPRRRGRRGRGDEARRARPGGRVAALPGRAAQLLPRASTTPPSAWPRRSAAHDNIAGYLKARHGLRVRRLPSSVMVGSMRRLDRHRREILLDDGLDAASQAFQLALQLAYLEMGAEIDAVLARRQLRHRERRAADPPGAGQLRAPRRC